jgi:hypothetical protein
MIFKKLVGNICYKQNVIYYLKLRITGMLAWSPDGSLKRAKIQWKEEDNLEMSKRGSVEDEWIDRETGRKGL